VPRSEPVSEHGAILVTQSRKRQPPFPEKKADCHLKRDRSFLITGFLVSDHAAGAAIRKRVPAARMLSGTASVTTSLTRVLIVPDPIPIGAIFAI